MKPAPLAMGLAGLAGGFLFAERLIARLSSPAWEVMTVGAVCGAP